MEKIPSPEGDLCSTVFTSQLFDAVKMSWRVSIKFTRVIETSDDGTSSLFSKATFQIHQSNTSNFYNGRNPPYNKVAFYLTNTDSSLLKVIHIFFEKKNLMKNSKKFCEKSDPGFRTHFYTTWYCNFSARQTDIHFVVPKNNFYLFLQKKSKSTIQKFFIGIICNN